MQARALRARPLLHVWLGVGMVSGCASWHTVPVSPRELVADARPGSVRVRQPDGARVVIARPEIVGDSLVDLRGHQPVGVGLGDVTEIAVRRTSAPQDGRAGPRHPRAAVRDHRWCVRAGRRLPFRRRGLGRALAVLVGEQVPVSNPGRAPVG